MKLAPLLILIALVGCASTPTAQPSTDGVSNPLARADLRRTEALKESDAVRGFTLEQGIPHLDTLNRHLTLQGDDLSAANAGLKVMGDGFSTALTEWTKSDQKLKDEQSHWFGKKARDAAPWLIGSAIVVFIAHEALSHYLAGGAFTKVIGGAIGLFRSKPATKFG